MNRAQKREVVVTLLKAERRDLADKFVRGEVVSRRRVKAGFEDSDAAWEAIANAWTKNQTAFMSVLNGKEKAAMSNSAMRSDYQKSFKKIRLALKNISNEIRNNSEAV